MNEIKIGTCTSCHFENILVETYRGSVLRPEPMDFCKVCAGSYIGNAAIYPNQYEPATLYQALGYCTNLILQAIEKSQSTSTES